MIWWLFKKKKKKAKSAYIHISGFCAYAEMLGYAYEKLYVYNFLYAINSSYLEFQVGREREVGLKKGIIIFFFLLYVHFLQ